MAQALVRIDQGLVEVVSAAAGAVDNGSYYQM
jgi:hypothetical protein